MSMPCSRMARTALGCSGLGLLPALAASIADQAAPRERDELCVVAIGERAAVEAPALDRDVPEQPLLAGLQALDAGGEEGVDALRQRRVAVLGAGRGELLEEQRVALAAAATSSPAPRAATSAR